ncbi:hypothetical protein PR048_030042 [Dryococelus australis]|uniref:Uncharacterized protein n=1 Tax=Dryococelus australis TaxID=614101 RepID=A0ABQ9GBQ7_9NEOP|nr:hypothetical protein PR048_030042 [Dryococelus australis]
MHFRYDSEMPGCIIASQFINGLATHTFRVNRPGRKIPVLPKTMAYPQGNVPIKAAKITDIQKLLRYISQEFQDFYTDILVRPTAEYHGPDVDSE